MPDDAGAAGPRTDPRSLTPARRGFPAPDVPSGAGLGFGPQAAPTAAAAATPIAPARWIGWRLRLLIAAVVLGCLAIFVLSRSLASQPWLGTSWQVGAGERPELVVAATGADPQVPGGRVLGSVSGASTSVDLMTDGLVPWRSPRWWVDDAARARQRLLHEQLAVALASPRVTLGFIDGSALEVRPLRRGFDALPARYWLLAAFALTLYLVAAVVLIAQPSHPNLLYALIAWCQSGNLLLAAVETTIELALPLELQRFDMPLRAAFDLITAAAMLNTVCLRLQVLPRSTLIALTGWFTALALSVAGQLGWLPEVWWWLQGSVAVLGMASIGLLSWSYRIEPHPLAIVLRRFGIASVAGWVLLTVALAATDRLPGAMPDVAALGPMLWYVFFGSLLLLVPLLGKPQRLMRELAGLALVSTIATSLDLLLMAAFSLDRLASLVLTLMLSLSVYARVHTLILNQQPGNGLLTTERMFEQLYRIVREVEARPERTAPLLAQLLRELFEPVETRLVDGHTWATRAAEDGSSLLVPVPTLGGDAGPGHGGSVMIRFAHQGQRLFTLDDARLTDRIVEQLRRAVAFDKAVEQGRREERLRLAQDLHDDIGARLLTLMYTAPSPEVEEYVRHTLQDLKTLTRGLAASSHPLSHAAAEWKTDLTQRLVAAQIELKWSTSFDSDVVLTVGQWSALTRVLRELASNCIAHARAQRVEITIALAAGRLELSIVDDGVGTEPKDWSHGLGLGGVRKRVKQLGGKVEWRQLIPHGIACRVVIARLTTEDGRAV